MRLKALTTPTVAKIVKKIPKGANISSVSTPGMPRLSNQTLKNKIATKLEAADAINLALGDMPNPKSSASPTEKTGAADNIKRVIPDKLVAEIDLNKVKTKKIFKWLKKNNIDDKEMLKTFNCGVGFCLIINPSKFNKVKKLFSNEFKPYVIGKISEGTKKIKLNEKINWF